jgi:hypothetical protein
MEGVSLVPARITEAIEPTEALAADAVKALAEDIQTLCYYQETQGVASATIKQLHKAYRVLQPIVEFYVGDESPLIWSAPDWKFKPKEKK